MTIIWRLVKAYHSLDYWKCRKWNHGFLGLRGIPSVWFLWSRGSQSLKKTQRRWSRNPYIILAGSSRRCWKETVYVLGQHACYPIPHPAFSSAIKMVQQSHVSTGDKAGGALEYPCGPPTCCADRRVCARQSSNEEVSSLASSCSPAEWMVVRSCSRPS